MSDEIKSSGKNVLKFSKKSGAANPPSDDANLPDQPNDKKPKRITILHDIKNLVLEGKLCRKYYVVENRDGSRFIVRQVAETPKEVIPVSPKSLVYDIQSYCEFAKKDNEDYFISSKEAHDIKDIWISSQPIPTPKVVAFKSDDSFCYKKLDFDYCPDSISLDKFPTWKKLLNNIKHNPLTLVHFIGSLFFEQSEQSKYLWMNGHGGEGKSSIIRFLQKMLGGHTCVSLSAPITNSSQEKWNAQIVGKRLGFFPDCASATFVQSSHFKGLTGGDNISAERKFQDPISVENTCRFIFASNVRPNISNAAWSRRRILFVEFKSKFDEGRDIEFDPLFEEKLFREGSQFIQYCMKEYRGACPNFEPIKNQDETVIDNLAAANGCDYNDFFHKKFGLEVLEKDHHYNGKEYFVYKTHFSEFNRIVSERFNDPKSRRGFKNYIEEEFGIALEPIWLDGAKKTGYKVRVKR